MGSIPKKIIKRLVDEKAKGATYTSITKRLNDDSIPSKTRRKWAIATVRQVILNVLKRDEAMQISEG